MPSRSGEKRIALVLVVSNYERAGAISLPGAAHDSHRMTSALTKAGFKTELALDLDLKGMRKKLAEFGAASSSYDVAAIYTTDFPRITSSAFLGFQEVEQRCLLSMVQAT